MNLPDILLKLQTLDGKFPSEALKATIAQREQMIPELLQILEQAKANPEYLLEESKYMGHIYALYLLAQFREKSAYPLIVNFFSLPKELSLDSTGDVVTESLPQILASVYDGNDAPLKGLIENPQINEYVRSSALKTFIVLVACGQKSRDEVMAYFQSLFRGKLEREYSFTWDSLVVACIDLYPEEVYEDIRQAYADDLVEIFWVRFEDVERTYELGKDKALESLLNNQRNLLINDTIEELQYWACFTPSPKTKKKEKPAPRFSEPRKGPKIGRNAPCPCGSGKKYQKCCGA